MMERVLLQQLTQHDAFKQLVEFQVELEQTQLSRANEFLEIAGVEWRIDIPSKEERATQLADGIAALATGEFAEFYARRWADVHSHAEPENVAAYADMEQEAWHDQMGAWAEAYKERGVEGSEQSIIEGHVFNRFGVPLETFVNAIVRWDEDDQQDALGTFFGGEAATTKPAPLFVGLDTADHALKAARDAILDDTDERTDAETEAE